ncbi:hypothetical protein FRB93_008869 [Tulasnella sp. JGI-2019a]|nr:hypothetical protein FRB93_008869 [Tulasnella sp. JGI-2019a]
MPGKEPKGVSNTRRWARALLKTFTGSGSSSPTPDTPPPYSPDKNVAVEGEPKALLCHETPLTSPARIMGVDEYGRVIGYIGPSSPTASWFNFQPAEKAFVLEVPIICGEENISSGLKESPELFRLHMRNPSEAAVVGNFHFLGVQLDVTLSKRNEAWMLAACDEGKSGPVFKDRARMLTSASNAAREGNSPFGSPASSKIWSIHAIEGDCEELRMSWPDKDSVIAPLKATSEQTPKQAGAPHHLWARRQTHAISTAEGPIRLIVERCSGP